MLCKTVVRRALLLHLTGTRIRTYAAMATPPQSFQLDRSIFNQSFYAEIRDFWFAGLPPKASAPPFELTKRWWGVSRTEEQKSAFDEECRTLSMPALDSIGPSKLGLSSFKSYEEEVEQADTLSAPFLAEVKEAQKEDERKGAETMLSLILLLDQMPRNIYRDQEGLRLVYGHYDRLVHALLRSCMALKPSPVEHEYWRGKPVYKTWILMPLVHTEHLSTHRLLNERMAQLRKECEDAEDEAALAYTDRGAKAHAEHWTPLERFGRYPHRNECLGRKNTAEEEEFMETAETFGVKQNTDKKEKEKKKQEVKSEL